MSRHTDWRSLVMQVDPDHARSSNTVVEYEFTSKSRGGDERTHDGQKRIFTGDYRRRGPYTPVATPDHALTWNGVPLSWGGRVLTWTGDEE